VDERKKNWWWLWTNSFSKCFYKEKKIRVVLLRLIKR
jgi:hypothetical protein